MVSLRRGYFSPARLIAVVITAILIATLAYFWTEGIKTATATYPTQNLYLPFSSGQSWSFQGAHGWDGQYSVWNSLDFIPPSQVSGYWAVTAAGGGSFAGGTAQVHLDGCGSSGGYVRLDHGNHWYTTYYHLADISVSEGQLIGAEGLIGHAGYPQSSNCFGAEGSGIHDHFSLWMDGTASCPTFRPYRGSAMNLACSAAWNHFSGGNHTMLLGNWIVSSPNYPPSQYLGCMTRLTDGLQYCQSSAGVATGSILQDDVPSYYPALNGVSCPQVPSATYEIGNSPLLFYASPTLITLHLQQVVISTYSWCFQVWLHVPDGSAITNVDFNVSYWCNGARDRITYPWSTGLAAYGDFYVSTGPVTNCSQSTNVDDAAGAGTSFTVHDMTFSYPDTYAHYP